MHKFFFSFVVAQHLHGLAFCPVKVQRRNIAGETYWTVGAAALGKMVSARSTSLGSITGV